MLNCHVILCLKIANFIFLKILIILNFTKKYFILSRGFFEVKIILTGSNFLCIFFLLFFKLHKKIKLKTQFFTI